MLSSLALVSPAFCDTRDLSLTLAQFLSLSCHDEPSGSLQLDLSVFLLASHGAPNSGTYFSTLVVLPRIVIFPYFLFVSLSFKMFFHFFQTTNDPVPRGRPPAELNGKG